MMKTLNREIAQMLGSEYKNHKNPNKDAGLEGYWYWTEPVKGYPKINEVEEVAAWKVGAFKFESSWDWLMYAVEWIEDVNFSVVIGGGNNCIIVDKDEITYWETTNASTKIEATYNTVAKFATWWNNKST
jgi:hypothetical protein